MSKHKIVFLPYNKEIEIEAGDTILRAAMNAGVHINASCGGEGVCGKCRIILEKGSIPAEPSAMLTREDIDKGYRLACVSHVGDDLVVRIPSESLVEKNTLNIAPSPRKTAHIKTMDFNQLREEGLFLPPVEKIYVELPPPSAADNASDVTRLVTHLKLNHNESKLQLTLPVIRKISDVIRMQDFKATVTLERPIREGNKSRIINIQPGDTTGRNYAVALDIGTTTIYAQLVNLIDGEAVVQYGEFNGQISYGEDVISRIVYAEKEGGLERLRQVVVGTINTVIDKLKKRSGVDPEDISSITIAGNTTMTQLFLGVNPKYIRRAPYVPASTLYPPLNAAGLGLHLEPHVMALVYPQVSSYVGGDIVAGVMGSGMYRSEKLTLYIDIGTNAEIVIGNKDWLACTACSAGPAFEGGGIKLGMRASKGAIEDFSLDPVTFEPMIVTVGNVRAKGICGSGLITMVALLYEYGVIDSRGKFNRDLDTPRIRKTDDIWEYVVVWADQTQIGRDVVLTEPDIDNLIRAKGAVYSGCQTLLEEVGLTIGDIEQIILAGGFGSYIDLEKAMTIGFLPEIDPSKVTFIGNGSLMGARMSSLTNRLRRDVGDVTKAMTNFELSETPSYMDHYIAALFLPHTDLNLFPRLKSRMDARREALRK
ncbi:corrinoid activation/regeneration protein AcsV [Desulfatiferula olefinivorans]